MKINFGFIAGLLAGVGVGYYLASNGIDLKETVNKISDAVSEGIDTGKEFVRALVEEKD